MSELRYNKGGINAMVAIRVETIIFVNAKIDCETKIYENLHEMANHVS
jgi:hypothetical protein